MQCMYCARALHVNQEWELYSICICRVSHVANVELSSGTLRLYATARGMRLLVTTVVNRVSRHKSRIVNRPLHLTAAACNTIPEKKSC